MQFPPPGGQIAMAPGSAGQEKVAAGSSGQKEVGFAVQRPKVQTALEMLFGRLEVTGLNRCLGFQ
jgi:hypothetical protein